MSTRTHERRAVTSRRCARLHAMNDVPTPPAAPMTASIVPPRTRSSVDFCSRSPPHPHQRRQAHPAVTGSEEKVPCAGTEWPRRCRLRASPEVDHDERRPPGRAVSASVSSSARCSASNLSSTTSGVKSMPWARIGVPVGESLNVQASSARSPSSSTAEPTSAGCDRSSYQNTNRFSCIQHGVTTPVRGIPRLSRGRRVR